MFKNLEEGGKVFPELCDWVAHSIESGLVAAINPHINVASAKLIPKGDKICEVIAELKEEPDGL